MSLQPAILNASNLLYYNIQKVLLADSGGPSSEPMTLDV